MKKDLHYRISTLLFILIQIFIVLSLNAQNLEDGLISHYEFSNNYLDSSPNQLHGDGDRTNFTDDRFNESNSALNFSGNSCFNLPSSPLLKPQFPFSISLWFKLDELDSAAGIHYSLFGSDQTQNNYHGAHVTVLYTGEILIGYGDDSGCTSTQCRKGIISLDKVEINNWYHLVAVFEDPSTFQLYLNGCELPSEQSGTGREIIAYSDIPGAIGKYDHTSITTNPLSYFKGTIDDFYFWSRVVTQEEISILNDNFHSVPTKDFIYDGCIGDGYEIRFEEQVFNEQNSSGTAFIKSMIGCDTLINVQLNFIDKIDSTITYNGCLGDNFVLNLNDQQFNQQNPTGEVLLSTNEGCDTLVKIDLTFNENFDSLFNYSGIAGDGFNINIDDIIFDESNPTGLITVEGESGCDTVFTVSLEFEVLKDCKYYIPNIISIEASNSLNKTHMVFSADDCSIEYLQYIVFDRWGNKIHDNHIAWEGTFGNKIPNEGIYTYSIRFRIEDELIDEKGTILVVK